MNILGINGLGISPSACLVQEGRLVAMAEEERFNRLKGSFGLMPEKSTRFCLDYAQLRLQDIDYIAFGWDADLYRFFMPYFFLSIYIKRSPKFQGISNLFRICRELARYHPANVRRMLTKMFRDAGIKGKLPPVKFVPHHLAHAASSFYCSGLEDAYLLVIDGSGENKCTTVMKGKGLEIKEISSFNIPDSLGWFYQSITEFLGFIPNRHEGKVMALASYGRRDKQIFEKIKKMIPYGKKGKYKYNAEYSFMGRHSQGSIYSEKMVSLLGSPLRYGEPLLDVHKNIAQCAQSILEEITAGIVQNIALSPDYKGRLCIAGGVGLNCKMNGFIAGMECVDRIFIPPFPNDAGSALGAGLYLSQQKGFNPKFKMEHSYWGPAFTGQDIRETLIKYRVKFRKDNRIEYTVAKLLSQDKIVGWFQGRMEVGPRALGARSILANPAKSRMKEYINKKVKGRETWRPFAPSILYEEREEYIINPKEAPFMELSYRVTEEAKLKIPAVVHIDNTTRPHFVKKEVNPRYWKVIDEFRKLSGIAAVLNTSFNANEEPIVCTPEQALKTFYASGMDYLALDDFLIYK